MASVVDLAVVDLAVAVEYYESLLAVTPETKGSNSATLVGDHMRLNLRKSPPAAPSDTTLQVTCGLLARILDAAMKANCTISAESPEQVKLTDQYGQQWTLRCHLS